MDPIGVWIGHGIFTMVHEDPSMAHGGRCRICDGHGLQDALSSKARIEWTFGCPINGEREPKLAAMSAYSNFWLTAILMLWVVQMGHNRWCNEKNFLQGVAMEVCRLR